MKNLRISDMISGIRYKVTKGSLNHILNKNDICYLVADGSGDLIINEEINIKLKLWSVHNEEVRVAAMPHEYVIVQAKIKNLELIAKQLLEQL